MDFEFFYLKTNVTANQQQQRHSQHRYQDLNPYRGYYNQHITPVPNYRPYYTSSYTVAPHRTSYQHIESSPMSSASLPLWQWPTGLTFEVFKDLSSYSEKEKLYTALGLALSVFFITKKFEIAGAALIYFIGARGGGIVNSVVVGALYAWKKNNITLLMAMAGIWYLLSGYKL